MTVVALTNGDGQTALLLSDTRGARRRVRLRSQLPPCRWRIASMMRAT
jgi:hypothetical protein